tara:strand:+ start:276 stop:404 length:129 start_codon:yes stop_codon:yes gene_type:complete
MKQQQESERILTVRWNKPQKEERKYSDDRETETIVEIFSKTY